MQSLDRTCRGCVSLSQRHSQSDEQMGAEHLRVPISDIVDGVSYGVLFHSFAACNVKQDS